MRHSPLLTHAQCQAVERIVRLGSLYYSGLAAGCRIKPRLWPLMVGPTGSGKSFLAREAAHLLDAAYKRISYGDWVVQGSRQVSTLYSIINEALMYQRLVVHIDELDKLPVGNVEDWSRAVGTELWGLLDGELPVRRFVGDPEMKLKPQEAMALSSGKLMTQIFIVGSGTWQNSYDEAKAGRLLGFKGTAAGANAEAHVISSLESTRGVASELLARFNGTLLFLEPPGADEALAILEQLGALAFAQESQIDARAQLIHLLPRQGFRALESVLTELLLLGWNPRPQRSEEQKLLF